MTLLNNMATGMAVHDGYKKLVAFLVSHGASFKKVGCDNSTMSESDSIGGETPKGRHDNM